MNPALVEFASTVTELGTVTATLLLDRVKGRSPVGAGPVNDTVHATKPDPVTASLLQYNALTAGVLSLVWLILLSFPEAIKRAPPHADIHKGRQQSEKMSSARHQ